MSNDQSQERLLSRLQTLRVQAASQKKVMERMTIGSVGHINSRGRYQATLLDIKSVENLLEAATDK